MKPSYKRLVVRSMLAVAGAVIATSAIAQFGPHGASGSKMERMFERLDGDRDGSISRAEARMAGTRRFAHLDDDGDGAVTRDEMIAAITKRVVRKASKRFDRLDRNGDGRLSDAEFAAMSSARFTRADTDGDGRVSRDEARERFRAWMGPHRKDDTDVN